MQVLSNIHAVKQLTIFSLLSLLIKESWCSFKNGKKVQYPYLVFEGPFGLQQCVKECLFRKRCQIVGYHRGQLRCELGGSNDFINVPDSEYKTAFRTELLEYQQLLGHCANHICEAGQKCIVTKSEQLECVTSDCDKINGYSMMNSGDDYACQKVYAIGYRTVSYNTATSRCQEDDGRLMIMNKAWKINALVDLLFPDDGWFFINGFKNENNVWKYNDGNDFVQIASVQYTLKVETEHVAMIKEGKVVSYPENDKKYGFICEM